MKCRTHYACYTGYQNDAQNGLRPEMTTQKFRQRSHGYCPARILEARLAQPKWTTVLLDELAGGQQWF